MVQLDGIKAVIFDFDGLMIESESIAYQIWCEVLGQYSKNFTVEIYRNVIGQAPCATGIIGNLLVGTDGEGVPRWFSGAWPHRPDAIPYGSRLGFWCSL